MSELPNSWNRTPLFPGLGRRELERAQAVAAGPVARWLAAGGTGGSEPRVPKKGTWERPRLPDRQRQHRRLLKYALCTRSYNLPTRALSLQRSIPLRLEASLILTPLQKRLGWPDTPHQVR